MVGRVGDPVLDWLAPDPPLTIGRILIDPTDPTFELNLYDPQVVPVPANQYIYLRGTNTCNKHITYNHHVPKRPAARAQRVLIYHLAKVLWAEV